MQAAEIAVAARRPGMNGRPSSASRNRGAIRMIAATAANDSWKPGSSRLYGFTQSSTASPAAYRCHGSDGRDSSQAADASTPATPARTTDGDGPTSPT